MKRNPRSYAKTLLAALPCLLFSANALATATSAYEAAPTLQAADILDAEHLHAAHYTVATKIKNDGAMNRFSISSDIQILDVYGNQMMTERTHEIDAIVALREIKQGDAFSNGLKAAANAPIALTRNLITDPVGTLGAVPGGISNFLQDVGAAISGVGKNNRPEDDSVVKDLIGFNSVKRRLAAELGVDPYSTNSVLQQELNDVAWSMFAGGAPIEVAMMAAPMAASLSVKIADSSQGEQHDWKLAPSTLLHAAEKAAMDMGLNEEETNALVRHPVCSPRHVSVTVSAMALLDGVAGRDEFLRHAGKAATEDDCQNNMQTAKLIYMYHTNEQPLTTLLYRQGSVMGEDVTGVTVSPLRADYLAWTEANAARFETATATPARHSVWLTGTASPMTRERLAGMGITLQENALANSKGSINVVKALLPERLVETADVPAKN